MLQNFGSHLKHEREMRGISLEEIAASTKIQIRYLKSLENNQFDELPGKVFIKGFIRSYGKTIGCNEEDLISAYDESTGAHRESANQIEQDLEDRQQSRSSSIRVNLLGAVALVVVLAVGVWYMNGPLSQSSQQSEDSAMGEVPADEVVMGMSSQPGSQGPSQKLSSSLEKTAEESPAEIVKSSPSKAVENSPAKNMGGKKPPEGVLATSDGEEEAVISKPVQAVEQTILNNGVSKSENDAILETIQDQLIQNVSADSASNSETPSELRLVIRVSDNSWFNLQIDNKREMDFIMPSGASKTVLAQSEIRITVGNLRSTHLTLNDKVLALPESPDNVVRNLIVNTEMIE